MPASLLPSHHINIPSSSSGGGGGPLTGGRRVSNTSRKLRSRRGWIVLVCCALLVLGYQGLSRGGGAAGDDDHAAEVLQRQRQAAGAAGGSSTGGIMSPRQEGRAQAALARLLPFGLGRGGNVNDDDGDADRRAGASSGIHLLTEDEDELIAEDDRYYDSLPEGAEHHSTNKSSYSPSSVTGADEDDEDEDEDENSGAGGAAATAALPQFHSLIPLDDRLGSDANPALSEQARSRLIGVEALTRHSAIRALSHYLYEGGELPRRWLDTDVDAVHGQTPLDKVKERVWKHAGGDGMEDQLFEVIQAGDQDLGEDTFEEGWKAFADERLKVVIFSKVRTEKARRTAPPLRVLKSRCSLLRSPTAHSPAKQKPSFKSTRFTRDRSSSSSINAKTVPSSRRCCTPSPAGAPYPTSWSTLRRSEVRTR